MRVGQLVCQGGEQLVSFHPGAELPDESPNPLTLETQAEVGLHPGLVAFQSSGVKLGGEVLEQFMGAGLVA
ncbi:hypothetical protein D9M71_808860 [compost metagenome]